MCHLPPAKQMAPDAATNDAAQRCHAAMDAAGVAACMIENIMQ